MTSFAPLTAGDHEIRVATDDAEVKASQALRYRVFYEELGAKPTPEMAASKRDFDEFDEYCDHLLVIDRTRGSGPEGIIGTYRLTRREQAEQVGRFYTSDEYDISPILENGGTIMELGRSCVDVAYRSKSTMQLLWRGIAAYVFHHNIDLMFGCASLHGTDPKQLAVPLSYLHHNHMAPEYLRPKALPERYTSMNLLPADQIDARRALAQLAAVVQRLFAAGGLRG